MALITTPGAADADAYISVADADTYFGNRLHVSDWTGATSANKEAAIKWATRILDWQPWDGNRASYTQALRWPRSGVLNRDEDDELDFESIPAFLEEATCELAIKLIASDITQTPSTDGIKEIKVGDIQLKLDDLYNRPDMLPRPVQELIAPFILSGVTGSIDLIRS